MRKLKLYSACSLNGKIAKKNGNVDWLNELPNPENTDHGFAEFFDSIDTTVQGFKTYHQVLSWDIEFPYKGKRNYVFTRNQKRENTEDVTFVAENHIDFIANLKKQKGKDIWLIGGGQINRMLLNAGLIDELIVFVMPIVLTEGIELFEGLPKESQLKLIDSKTYSTGTVEMRYQFS